MVIAIAGKSGDHSDGETFVDDEIAILSSGERILTYHGGLREIILVKSGNLVTNKDRPERVDDFQVGSANDAAVNSGQEEKSVRACESCRYVRLENRQKPLPQNLPVGRAGFEGTEPGGVGSQRPTLNSSATPVNNESTDGSNETEQEGVCSMCCDLGYHSHEIRTASSFPDNLRCHPTGAPVAPFGKEAGLMSIEAIIIIRDFLHEGISFVMFSFGKQPRSQGSKGWNKV